MTTDNRSVWSFATARVPAQFAAAVDQSAPDVEHALCHEQTLCGIDSDRTTVYRHLFRADSAKACRVCGVRAIEAPTQPSEQERLHHRILAVAPGQMREELLEALRCGARIRMWIEGPARSIGKHYARLSQVVEGGTALRQAVNTDDRVGLAKVDTGPWQFIVVLRPNSMPVIARAEPDDKSAAVADVTTIRESPAG